jgi:hypothetical protein
MNSLRFICILKEYLAAIKYEICQRLVQIILNLISLKMFPPGS